MVPIPIKIGWLLEYTEPGVRMGQSDEGGCSTEVATSELAEALDANDPRIHHGVWRFRVAYWNHAAMDSADPPAPMDGMQCAKL